MGYMKHMAHLGKCLQFFIELGIKLVATEKYHGTSTNISLIKNGGLKYHSGGEMVEPFKSIFNEQFLQEKLEEILEQNQWTNIKIYGEAYGGPRLFPKQMMGTYGPDTKFIVFDIKVNEGLLTEKFLDFFDTKGIVEHLGLDLVHYEECPFDITFENREKIIEWLEIQTNLPSMATYNKDKDNLREGIVVRPIKESVIGKKKERAIAKNVSGNFKEVMHPDKPKDIKTKKNLKVTNNKFSQYDELATTWVTENRGRHVLDEIRSNRDNKIITIKDVREFIDKILEDIKAESEGYFEWPQTDKESAELTRCIKKEAGGIFPDLCREFNFEEK